MGLLNRKTIAGPSLGHGLGPLLEAAKPPYNVSDFLLAILNQLAEWIPGQGYYAYLAESDDGELVLKATRTASGIATVGPNYAGLVLGTGIRAVPLTMGAPELPWVFRVGADGMLDVGLESKALFRIAVDSKNRVSEAVHGRVEQWLRQVAPLLELFLVAAGGHEEVAIHQVALDVRQSRQDLLLQIPHLMGLLAGLGIGVLKSGDAYLALWDGPSSAELVWLLGMGQAIADRIPPHDLYEGCRGFHLAVWQGGELPPSLASLGFRALAAVPIDGASGTTGVLCLATADALSTSSALMETMRLLANSLKSSLDSLDTSHLMARNYLEALLTATTLLDAADPYNVDHHLEVARLSARLAMKAGLSADRVRIVETAGRLHDLGMVAVALDIPFQSGNLAEQARAIIQRHPLVGAELLSGIPEAVLPSGVTRAVREHHERFDGLGYPDGLKGEQLSTEGRILACAEQFVARISARSYRQGLSAERALFEVEKLAGNQLDPQVVAWLLALYSARGVRPLAPV